MKRRTVIFSGGVVFGLAVMVGAFVILAILATLVRIYTEGHDIHVPFLDDNLGGIFQLSGADFTVLALSVLAGVIALVLWYRTVEKRL